ncbi:MAG: preprotein translocase subunit SecG [Puniceicoccales bacterium]|nr:preprotein translocase subunit SecG [Puniceicoccales bacterium]
MASFLIALFSVVLALIGIFTVVLVLLQQPGENGGFGTSLGGSALESAFGGDAGNILTKATIVCVASFFIISTLLSLAHIHRARKFSHEDVSFSPAHHSTVSGNVKAG